MAKDLDESEEDAELEELCQQVERLRAERGIVFNEPAEPGVGIVSLYDAASAAIDQSNRAVLSAGRVIRAGDVVKGRVLGVAMKFNLPLPILAPFDPETGLPAIVVGDLGSSKPTAFLLLFTNEESADRYGHSIGVEFDIEEMELEELIEHLDDACFEDAMVTEVMVDPIDDEATEAMRFPMHELVMRLKAAR